MGRELEMAGFMDRCKHSSVLVRGAGCANAALQLPALARTSPHACPRPLPFRITQARPAAVINGTALTAVVGHALPHAFACAGTRGASHLAKPKAHALPTPPAAPVIRATLPSNVKRPPRCSSTSSWLPLGFWGAKQAATVSVCWKDTFMKGCTIPCAGRNPKQQLVEK
jgi:hypothetical protein